MAFVVVYHLDREPETFEISDANPILNIGRSKDNDIVIQDLKISRKHAQLLFKDGFIYIEDLGSTNGVFINGQKKDYIKLNPNDEILIGDTLIIFNKDYNVSNILKQTVKRHEEFKKRLKNERVSKGITKAINFIDYIKGLEDVSAKDINKLLDKLKHMLSNVRTRVRDFEHSYDIFYTLYKLSESVNSVFDIKELLNLILDMILKIVKGERGFIMLYDKSKDKLVPVVIRKMHRDFEDGNFYSKPSFSVANKVFKSGKTIVSLNTLNTNDFKGAMSIVNMNLHMIMCAPLKTMSGIIGVLYIDSRSNIRGINEKDKWFIEGFANQAAIAIEKARLYNDLEESYLASVEVLANVLDALDPYTHGHSVRVAEYSIAIAEAMGLSNNEIKNIRYGALLHDIGKIAIPMSVIKKEGRLTDDEYKEIKQHPQRGFEIIKPIKFLQEKLAPIRFHHERYDGKGYPLRLKGEEIPLAARIVAVADAFDAMTSTRSYRRARSFDYAINEIKENSGKQFDPKVVEAFLKIAKPLYERLVSSENRD